MPHHQQVIVVERRFFTGASFAIERYDRERIWFETLEARVMFAAGDVDVTFGRGGLVHGSLVQDEVDAAVGLFPQSDGSIVVEGSNSRADRFMVRLGRDGKIDESASADGKVDLQQGNWESVEPQPFYAAGVTDHEGRFVLPIGTVLSNAEGRSAIRVRRFTRAGELDTTFAANGEVEVPLPVSAPYTLAQERGVIEDASGRLTVGVVVTDLTYLREFYLVRFSPDGLLDTTFGNAGILPVNGPGGTGFSGRLTHDKQGRLVLGGHTNLRGAIVRFDADGTLDPTFGDNGWFMTNQDQEWGWIGKPQIDSHGRIVARYLRDNPG